MYTKWTSHINDPTEKESFQNSVLAARRVLDRQMAILKEELNTLDRSELDVKQFSVPNWDYLQAYKNGCRAMLNFNLKLIDLDQQEIPHAR